MVAVVVTYNGDTGLALSLRYPGPRAWMRDDEIIGPQREVRIAASGSGWLWRLTARTYRHLASRDRLFLRLKLDQ